MKLSGKADTVAKQIIESFEKGTIPKGLSNIFINFNSISPSASWSWGNRLLCMFAGHTDARGYRQWSKVGRNVKAGQKAFNILAPMIAKKEDKNGDTKSFCYGFRSIPVSGRENRPAGSGKRLPCLRTVGSPGGRRPGQKPVTLKSPAARWRARIRGGANPRRG